MKPLRKSQALWTALPVAFFFGLGAQAGKGEVGVAQVAASLVALAATAGFIYGAARLAWIPLLRKTGLWVSSVVLVAALVLAVVGLGAASLAVGAQGFARTLPTVAAVTGLLFSWGQAAIHGADAPSRA
jgi:hypothetical protein